MWEEVILINISFSLLSKDQDDFQVRALSKNNTIDTHIESIVKSCLIQLLLPPKEEKNPLTQLMMDSQVEITSLITPSHRSW